MHRCPFGPYGSDHTRSSQAPPTAEWNGKDLSRPEAHPDGPVFKEFFFPDRNVLFQALDGVATDIECVPPMTRRRRDDHRVVSWAERPDAMCDRKPRKRPPQCGL